MPLLAVASAGMEVTPPASLAPTAGSARELEDPLLPIGRKYQP
jgi:hypothetical protein